MDIALPGMATWKTLDDAARQLGIGRRTLTRWISEGKLTGYTPGSVIKLVRNPNWDASTDYKPAYLDSITIKQGSDPAVTECSIHDNGQEGIRVFGDSQGNITRCDIYENCSRALLIAAGCETVVEDCRTWGRDDLFD